MNLYFRCTFESSAIDFFLFSVLLHNGPLCKRSGTQTGHIRLDASATTEHFSLNLGLYGGIVSRHWSVVSCVRGVSVGAGLGFPVGACAMLRFAPPTSDNKRNRQIARQPSWSCAKHASKFDIFAKIALRAHGKPSTIVYRAGWLVEPVLAQDSYCAPRRSKTLLNASAIAGTRHHIINKT